jgi:membrane-bound lytic murein transglycosylase D
MFNQTHDILKKCFNYLTIAAVVAMLPLQAQELASNTEINFCKETLPLYRRPVATQFEKALEHTASLPLNKIRFNAPKFFRTVEPILASYQIPNDFKYLCIVESALDPNALSAKGAFGFWQFMPETARAMGLVVNGQTDERQNLVKSTTAACQYFRELYRQLGSWTLVAAAYNLGPSKIREHVLATGNTNYYQWQLNAETRQYIFRVVAIKEMFNRPHIYERVLDKEVNFYSFLRNQGALLGLTVWPNTGTASKAKKLPNVSLPFFLSVCQSVAAGFVHLIPLPYKRNTFDAPQKSLIGTVGKPKTQPTTVNNGSDMPQLKLWWTSLPFYTRRRNELYMLPPRIKLSVKRQFWVA